MSGLRFKVLLVLLPLLGACHPLHPSVAPARLQTQTQQLQRRVALFPIEIGYTWDYELIVAPVSDPDAEEQGSYTVQIESIQQGPQETVLQLRAYDTFFTRYSFPSLVQSAQGIQLRDATYLGFGADEVKDLKLNFLPSALKGGLRWEDPHWIGKVIAQESVEVPAGRFTAWRIAVIGTWKQAYSAVGDYWIVPGEGIIRSRLSIPGWHVETRLLSGGVRHRLPQGNT